MLNRIFLPVFCLAFSIGCISYADYLAIQEGKKLQCGDWGCSPLFVNAKGQFYLVHRGRTYVAATNVAKSVLAQRDYQGDHIAGHRQKAIRFYEDRGLNHIAASAPEAVLKLNDFHSTGKSARPVDGSNPSFHEMVDRLKAGNAVAASEFPLAGERKLLCKVSGFREMQPAVVKVSDDKSHIEIIATGRNFSADRSPAYRNGVCMGYDSHDQRKSTVDPICFKKVEKKPFRQEEFEVVKDEKGYLLHANVVRPAWLSMKEDYGLDCFSDWRNDPPLGCQEVGHKSIYCPL